MIPEVEKTQTSDIRVERTPRESTILSCSKIDQKCPVEATETIKTYIGADYFSCIDTKK